MLPRLFIFIPYVKFPPSISRMVYSFFFFFFKQSQTSTCVSLFALLNTALVLQPETFGVSRLDIVFEPTDQLRSESDVLYPYSLDACGQYVPLLLETGAFVSRTRPVDSIDTETNCLNLSLFAGELYRYLSKPASVLGSVFEPQGRYNSLPSRLRHKYNTSLVPVQMNCYACPRGLENGPTASKRRVGLKTRAVVLSKRRLGR